MMEEASTPAASYTQGSVLHNDDGTVWLSPGVEPADLRLDHSQDGQTLLIHCGETLVAMLGTMGASVVAVEFADGRRMSVEELLDVMERGA